MMCGSKITLYYLAELSSQHYYSIILMEIFSALLIYIFFFLHMCVKEINLVSIKAATTLLPRKRSQ